MGGADPGWGGGQVMGDLMGRWYGAVSEQRNAVTGERGSGGFAGLPATARVNRAESSWPIQPVGGQASARHSNRATHSGA